MGLFDDLKKRVTDKVAERAADIAAERSKAAAKAFAKESLASAKGLGKRIEEELFGPSPEEEPPPASERTARATREREAGELLRGAAARNAEREASARQAELAAAARVEKAAKVEREVDDELAALKARLGKR